MFDVQLQPGANLPKRWEFAQTFRASPSEDFLQNLFKRYSTHEILTESQIQEIFSTVKTKPWEPEDYKTLVPAITDGLSLHSWISLWELLLFKNPESTLSCLVSLGYYEKIDSAYEKISYSNTQKRKVFICTVIGLQKSGKKLLLRRFLYKNSEENISSIVCGSVEESENITESKFLILSKNEEIYSDVVCMVYDGTVASMNYIKKLVIDEKKPRILLLNKNECKNSNTADSSIP